MAAHNPNELIAVVDESDNVVGADIRKNVHEKGLLHREASVLILNKNSEILLQKRKDNGRFDYSASGHFPLNETYLQGAKREVKEELGIFAENIKEILKVKVLFKYEGGQNNRFITLFEYSDNLRVNDFKIDKEEVDFIKYFKIEEIKSLINGREKFSSGFSEVFKAYCRVKGF